MHNGLITFLTCLHPPIAPYPSTTSDVVTVLCFWQDEDIYDWDCYMLRQDDGDVWLTVMTSDLWCGISYDMMETSDCHEDVLWSCYDHITSDITKYLDLGEPLELPMRGQCPGHVPRSNSANQRPDYTVTTARVSGGVTLAEQGAPKWYSLAPRLF